MADFDKGYMPFFFNWVEITSLLSDEDFGKVVRALCEHFKDGKSPEGIPLHLQMTYAFMLDGAERAVAYQKRVSERNKQNAAARWNKEEKKKKPDFYNFDPEDAFKRALERSYGK